MISAPKSEGEMSESAIPASGLSELNHAGLCDLEQAADYPEPQLPHLCNGAKMVTSRIPLLYELDKNAQGSPAEQGMSLAT